MQDVSNKLRIRFDNGVTIRGAYRYGDSANLAVELFVSDFNGAALHTIREIVPAKDHPDGFTAVVTAMESLKQYLLSCSINKFVGVAGMDVVKSILVAQSKERVKSKAA